MKENVTERYTKHQGKKENVTERYTKHQGIKENVTERYKTPRDKRKCY